MDVYYWVEADELILISSTHFGSVFVYSEHSRYVEIYENRPEITARETIMNETFILIGDF